MSATIIAVLVIIAVMLIMTLLAILHAGAREFDSMGHKALWVFVAAIPFFGFPIYFLFGVRRSRKAGSPPREQIDSGGEDSV